MIRAWLIISQLLELASLVPWLIIAGLSVMAFDSGYSKAAVLIVAAVWGYPVLLLICAVAAWVAYRRGSTTVALVSTSVPLLLAAPLVGYLMYASLT